LAARGSRPSIVSTAPSGLDEDTKSRPTRATEQQSIISQDRAKERVKVMNGSNRGVSESHWLRGPCAASGAPPKSPQKSRNIPRSHLFIGYSRKDNRHVSILRPPRNKPLNRRRITYPRTNKNELRFPAKSFRIALVFNRMLLNSTATPFPLEQPSPDYMTGYL